MTLERYVLSLAIGLLPPGRKAWGEAMRAEFEHARNNQNAFSWGCLGASLKENVSTGEGWARVGFVFIAALSVWLSGFFAVETVRNLVIRDFSFHLELLWGLGLLGFSGLPIVFAFAALAATKAPTDIRLLASIGHSASRTCLWLLGAMLVNLSLISIGLVEEARAASQTIETGFEIGLVTGAMFMSVAWFGRKNTVSMRNSALIACLLSVCFAGIYNLTQQFGPNSIGHNYAYTACWMASLMLITTVGNALFVWMQKSARPVARP